MNGACSFGESTGIIGLAAPTLVHIASYTAPPETYLLCITSRVLHQPSQDGSEEPLLATQMLRESLMCSLARVLRKCIALTYLGSEDLKTDELHKENVLDALSFASLRSDDGKPGALLSGSTMVQAVLGEVWGKNMI